jgi:hypothetical protein
MANTAASLVDHVLTTVPVRQWAAKHADQTAGRLRGSVIDDDGQAREMIFALVLHDQSNRSLSDLL